MRVHKLNADVSVLNDVAEIPGLGFLAVNGFVLHAAEPLVVDTGLGLPDRGFVSALAEVLDPADVQWIWLTHPDRDHTGSLFDLLAAAPRAKVITTFAGVGIMSTERPLPLDRVYLLNPGETFDLGDRTITAVRPPLFDNAATVGFFDNRSRAFFSSDCFGAPLSSAELAGAENILAVDRDELSQRQLLWTSVDSPWVHVVDETRFDRSLDPIRLFNPSLILSTHLPPASERTKELLATAARAPGLEPFVGPDQVALQAMLAQFEPA